VGIHEHSIWDNIEKLKQIGAAHILVLALENVIK
ncbi:MAG: ATP phosphoribosyltransferase, partial [Muribaculaceae bacterium]|nr:ATP phosphoribosyltransferase [Muribaculaceae bacterium]